MKTPKEDPKDKAARERERRLTKLERRESAEENAASLTSDISRVYGLGGLRNLGSFGMASGGAPGASPLASLVEGMMRSSPIAPRSKAVYPTAPKPRVNTGSLMKASK